MGLKKKKKTAKKKEVFKKPKIKDIETQQNIEKQELEEKKEIKNRTLEEVIEAIKEVKEITENPDEEIKQEIKTNQDTSAEFYEKKPKSAYQSTKFKKIEQDYEEKYSESEITTNNLEPLTYQDIERITKIDIVNTVFLNNKLSGWNNISPHEREDYENWKQLSPGAKIIWWMMVQNSGFGNVDIVYN